MVSAARRIALDALLDRHGQVTRRLESLLEAAALSPVDAHLATELALGVVRRQRTLDAIIRAYSDQPNRRLVPLVRQVLRMGIYQLALLDRVPDFAAVNESVEAARRQLPKTAGFVNAVLRNVARGLGEVEQARPAPAAESLWVAPDRVRRMDRAVFSSPAEQPARHLAEAGSLSDALARRYLERFGPLSEALDLAMQFNARPPIVARVNLARTTVAQAMAELAGAGVEAAVHENGRSVVLTGHAGMAALAAFREGRLSVQDPTATDAGDAVRAEPGMRVLDFCAAPGTKTVQLGEQLGGRGEIVAVDVSEEKLELVRQGARRCGLDIVRTVPAEQVGSLEPRSFDRVLVDAPCTNTGVLARRVEARWRFTEQDLQRVAADQRQILALAAIFLAPGGRLVYSTCSIEPEENEQVVQSLLSRQRPWRRLEHRHTRPVGWGPPTHYRDGGYWAALSPG